MLTRLAAVALLIPAVALGQEPPPSSPAGNPVYPAVPVTPAPPTVHPAVPVPPPPAYAPPAPVRPHTRDTWYIGFGLGTGSGSLATQGGGSFSFRDVAMGADTTTGALNFKVGGTLGPTLLLGFDLTGIATTGNGGFGTKVTLGVTNYDAMLTWFPWETGLLLRGGAGLSTLRLSADAYGQSGSTSYAGANVSAGAGYAFWLAERFNLTLNLDLSGQRYGSSSGGPRRSSFWAATLGFDWY